MILIRSTKSLCLMRRNCFGLIILQREKRLLIINVLTLLVYIKVIKHMGLLMIKTALTRLTQIHRCFVKNAGLFCVKDYCNHGHTGAYTLVTPKGKLYFADLRDLILVTV